VNGGYAIPGCNFSQMEQLQAVIQACVETESPVILQISAGARKYANATLAIAIGTSHGAYKFPKGANP
jgi:fructose-bisphosphate aldolase class II